MRALNPTAAALHARLVAGEQIPVVQLVELQLDAITLRYSTGGWPVLWGGYTWQSTGGRVEALETSADGTIDALSMTLPGVTPDDIAIALSQPLEGRPVRVWDCMLDPDTGAPAVLDDRPSWKGTLNVPGLRRGPVAELAVTAEHIAVRARRVKPSRYSDEQWQREHPGDTSLHFDPATDAAPVQWPLASWYAANT